MRKIFALLLCLAALLTLLCACADTVDEITILYNGEEISDLTLFVGQEISLEVSDGAKVKWQTDDSDVAAVEPDGYVRAKGVGEATVTATVGKASASVKFNVTEYIAVEEIVMKTKYTVKTGGFRSLGISVSPQNASDAQLTFAVAPDDGKITFSNGKVFASSDVVPQSQYQLTVTNRRSGVEASAILEISEETQLVAWTIGDSIFDFNDVNDDDMVQTILKNAGYTKWHMDNIAGRTVCAASSVGVLDHINVGMYEAWSEPDLILLQCGTNDCYYWQSQPGHFNEESIRAAIEDTCKYLCERYPDARKVWSTPIWRVDVSAEKLQFFIDSLHEICSKYDIEVFDLHLTDSFVNLNSENFGEALQDGIHPNAQGKAYYILEFGKYFAQK